MPSEGFYRLPAKFSDKVVVAAAGDISSLAWEQAQTSEKNARIQYDSAKLNYDNQIAYSQITATIGGRIESFDLDIHDIVSPQSRICVISGEGSKLTIKMKELYHDVYSKKSAYEAACDGYGSAKKAKDGYQRMYQLGMLSRQNR